MICVNDLADLKCHKKEVLENLLILITPYAPHIAEELWNLLGNEGTILDARFPSYDPALLVENSKEYPVSINGKGAYQYQFGFGSCAGRCRRDRIANDVVQKWLGGKAPKKIIYVKNKMVNVVI
jgi:leucyl-tRNA synthetase